jgi:predicted DNA-binding transcriptional regulator YafY
MHDQNKLIRMLEMLMFLSSGIKYNIMEIASRFEISERTAHRYLQTFRNVGFIIPKPDTGLYWIDKTSPYFREISELLHFSKEEAYILQRAIHSIDDENTLKSNLVNKLYSLYDFDRVADTIVKKEHSYNVHQLLYAIKNKKQAILEGYKSANSSIVNDRLIEPFDFTTNYVAVWGYDCSDQTCKTFKTTRIRSVKVLSESWENTSSHKIIPLDVFRIGSNKHIPVKMILSLRAFELLTEEYPLSEPYVKKADNQKYLYDGWVSSFEGIARFVLGLCNEIEILEPDELKKYIREKVKKFVN